MAFDPASNRAKYQHRREAGPAWNQNEQRKLDQQYGCGNTLYGWDGDTLAFENRPHDLGARLTHYVYEPGTFVPVAQALEHRSIKLLLEPVYDFPYDIERDPVWQHKPAPTPFDAFAWYQCDHLGTPMELTDEQGEVAWSGTYKAWGAAQEKRSDTAKRAGIHNPLRFQGQYFDVETGLHYNRYRYYDPGVGRFVGKDPIGFAGGLNVYSYAPNPVAWTDPFGLSKCCRPSIAECEKILEEGGVQVGSHRDMKAAGGGLYDSHHIYQHAAVGNLPKYDYYDAPAVVLQGRNMDGTTRGTPHYNANRVQDQRGGGSLAAERRIAYKAVRRAGLTSQQSRCSILKADAYFSDIGASATSNTTIPKRRK
ncbi:RHS repeat-associated core domain-containing protein [Pseudomonas sp. B21-032]|uniref:RHS repeat-associated core domain-containing protein n=1 Tax=Pseudomonas sp. B21-032 TaxID=2895483 RepID=UPI002852E931|nr:RHS repeat-associated core domain-containing protein [Pseudomonas sp. B21-032]